MTQRVMVYIICRLIEVDQAGTGAVVADWWVDCTQNGSSDIAAVKTAHNEAGNNTKTSVTQYHVYYADGGHARLKENYYLAEEKALWPSNASLRPAVLVPTPELLPV
jgi:hypothetical protein